MATLKDSEASEQKYFSKYNEDCSILYSTVVINFYFQTMGMGSWEHKERRSVGFDVPSPTDNTKGLAEALKWTQSRPRDPSGPAQGGGDLMKVDDLV